MMDLCFDFFRVSKEKKDLKETKGSKSKVLSFVVYILLQWLDPVNDY